MRTDPLPTGPVARIGITYYHYDPHCTAANCPIGVWFVSSADGSATWSRPVQVAGPMQSSWLATVGQGAMISDFISTTVLPGGNAVTAFPLATAPAGGLLHQDMYAVRGGMPIRGGLAIVADLARNSASPQAGLGNITDPRSWPHCVPSPSACPASPESPR
jgi:hypothetical protein